MIELRINPTDPEMIDLISVHNGTVMLWGVVHRDALRELEIDGNSLTRDDLENREYYIEAVEVKK